MEDAVKLLRMAQDVGKVGHSWHSLLVHATSQVFILTPEAPEEYSCRDMWGGLAPEDIEFQLRQPTPAQGTLLIKCKYCPFF